MVYLAGQKCQTISRTASHMHEWEVGTLLQNQYETFKTQVSGTQKRPTAGFLGTENLRNTSVDDQLCFGASCGWEEVFRHKQLDSHLKTDQDFSATLYTFPQPVPCALGLQMLSAATCLLQ